MRVTTLTPALSLYGLTSWVKTMKAALHACKVVLGWEPPESQVSNEEADCLLAHASTADVVVEIGCYEGKTTSMLAKQCRGTIYTIDPFFRGRLGVCYGELVAKTHCRREGLRNIEFIKAFSYEVAPGFHKIID